MTTLAEQLQAVLEPLATGGSWPMEAAQGTLPPYIVYQDIISNTKNTLSGATDLQNTLMQIDAYDTSYAAAKALGKSIATALAAASFTNIKLNDQMLRDPDTKLHRALLEFSIWSTN